jgi:U3 small nucleolar RNA-associated protein 10
LDEQAELLTMSIKTSSKSAVAENTGTLFNIVLQALDFRRMLQVEGKNDHYDEAQIQKIEQQIIDAIVAMILKLNDATFRPLFIKLVEWMSKKLPKSDVTGRTLRGISFYRFVGALFERLKVRTAKYLCRFYTDFDSPLSLAIRVTSWIMLHAH